MAIFISNIRRHGAVAAAAAGLSDWPAVMTSQDARSEIEEIAD